MNEDMIIQMLLEHEAKIDAIQRNMVTKEEHNQTMEILDAILGIVKKIDQELTFTRERIGRLEKHCGYTA